MKKLWRRVTKRSPSRGGEASPKSGSTRGSVASLNTGYEVREKDLGKLHKAAWKGDLNKVKQLAKKDPSPLDKQNRTPLHLACVQGHEYIVQELLEWKAKANIGDNQSKTPLMRAVEFQQEACVNLLLSYDVDIDTVDSQGNTPLHMAVEGGNLNIVNMLIKSGASLNTRNKEGFAPLHIAVRYKHIEVCLMMLQEKADVNVEDTNLRTPLMYACQEGSINLVKLLLEFNADTTHKDSKGWTADDCAVIQGHHPCSQLISDYNMKMSHGTPLTSPRSSSQASSLLNTPRDKNLIGLPVLDGGDDDSDNETVSKVSGAPGSDSWADSPDASVVDDVGKKGKDVSDIEEDVFEDKKVAAPKINLAKFAKNIRISESDTDGESVRGLTPRKQPVSKGSSGDNSGTEHGYVKGEMAGKPNNQAARQISWQSQTSGEDNSWGDSPTTPRKNLAQKVSFKREEKISDIIESNADSDGHDPREKTREVVTPITAAKLTGETSITQAEVGYVPSVVPTRAAPASAEKMRALMEELGISDVDDISDISEDATEPTPPLPESLPPKMTHAEPTKEDSEWDSSVVSGMMSTPRPGILKKGLIIGKENSEVYTAIVQQQQPQARTEKPQVKPGDDSSVWDSTETDVIPQVRQTVQPHAIALHHEESISEWDSELEDLAHPVTGLKVTPPPSSLPMPVFNRENNKMDDDDWDSTVEMATSRMNAGLYYKEIDVVKPKDASESGIQVAKKDASIAEDAASKSIKFANVSEGLTESEDGQHSESNWDSEADELPSNAGDSPVYVPTVGNLFGITTHYQPPVENIQLQKTASPKPAVDSDEDTESISSWEKERKMSKLDLKKEQPDLEKKLMNQQVEEGKTEEKEAYEFTRKKQEIMEAAEIQEEQRKILQTKEAARQDEMERQWKVETERQVEIERQWEIEEADVNEMLTNEAEEVIQFPGDFSDTVDSVLYQQQELNRIDEQFQKERAEREKREEEEERQRQEQAEETRKLKEFEEKNKTVSLSAMFTSTPPSVPPKPTMSMKTQQPVFSGVYANTGSSAVQEIRQRLQVIPSHQTAALSAPALFYQDGDSFDDDEFQPSDTPGDERPSIPRFYQPGLYRPHDPLDDDALSYTSTEFEDPIQSTPSYGKERDILAHINISDPSSLLKVQEYVRDTIHSLDQERNQRVVLENKLRLANKEKTETEKKLENLIQQKSALEQNKLDIEAKIRSLEYNVSEEKEKRANAEVLLSKTKEQLARKESQFSSELEAKQKADLALRNLQIEMRTATNVIKELQEEKEELQRQLTHSNNARMLQEQINDDQQKLLIRQQQQTSKHDGDYLESSLEFSGDSNQLKTELYALKMEMERQRSRFKDEISLMGAENEELMTRVEELRNDIKLNEEALAHATMQYNIQVTSLRTDISTANSVAERERTVKEKLETEVESLKTRLNSASQEMDKAIKARNEIERELQKERESMSREMDRKDSEITSLKDNVQHLNQRLATTDSKLSSLENELHMSNTSLMERTTSVQLLQQELERHKTSNNSLEHNCRLEKEQNAKLQAKVESLQEKLSQLQHENLSLHQQAESLRMNSGNLPGSDANEKLNNILTNLRADSDRAKASLEERNNNLLEQVARLREEVRGSEARRTTLEQDLRRLHDEHSDLVKKLSHAEASLQITTKAKEQLEQERAQLKMELEKFQQRYQITHDKSVEAQARMSELVDRLEKAENNSLYSRQQLVDSSVNIQGLVKSKLEQDDSLQQLHIDNAKLEAELKYEKQRADMLYQDLQDSHKVRNNLEALCANFKSTSAHLEDRLGSDNGFEDSRLDEETAARAMYEAEARDHKALYDQEIKSRSKLGLRIADLERNKQMSESKIMEEKSRANLANEESRSVKARLEAEIAKSQQLQQDVSTLKIHLKTAKSKIKDMNGSIGQDSHAGFHRDVNNMDTFVSTQPQQSTDFNGDIRSELEVKYRKELNQKLENVNRFLDSQSQLRNRLDTSRTEVEARLLSEKRRLEEEIYNLRVMFEQAVAQRETKEMEAKRFRELYESEMSWRMKVSDQLQSATEKSLNLKSKLNNERHHRNRLAGSIGNLSSSIVSNNSFDIGMLNGFHEDELSNKIKAELDRSIAKHLEAAPHDHKPVLRPTKDSVRFSSSLTQSTQDYIDILKRKYCL